MHNLRKFWEKFNGQVVEDGDKTSFHPSFLVPSSLLGVHGNSLWRDVLPFQASNQKPLPSTSKQKVSQLTTQTAKKNCWPTSQSGRQTDFKKSVSKHINYQVSHLIKHQNWQVNQFISLVNQSANQETQPTNYQLTSQPAQWSTRQSIGKTPTTVAPPKQPVTFHQIHQPLLIKLASQSAD